MTLYEYLRLVGIGDTRLDKKELWEITAAPIAVAALFDAIIPDRLGEKWLEGHGEGVPSPVVGREGCGKCKMVISDRHYSIMGSRGWWWGFVEMPPPSL